MTSIYAASSIHSKSTLSKKYEVDTSAMWNGGEQFRAKNEDTTDTQSFTNFMQQFSLDIGRFDEIPSWVNSLRLLIFPVFLCLNSLGLIIVENATPSIFNGVITVLSRFIKLVPAETEFNTSLTVNISILLLYLTLIYLLARDIYKYKQGSSPSKLDIFVWAIFSRIITPILSSYLSYYFSMHLCQIFVNASTEVLINLIISIPLIVIQIAYLFFSCSVYNATPIIRQNDKSQIWFSHSNLDWRLNVVIFVLIFFQSILTFISSPIKESLFGAAACICAILFGIYMWYALPYIYPKSNVILVSAAIISIPFSWFPIINYEFPNASAYYFIASIIFIIPSYFLAKFVVSRRIVKIIDQFNEMRASEEDSDEETKMDPLSAAIMHLNKTRNVDFFKLKISGETQLSLYLRVGFLFNVVEVEDQTFIKWCTDQTIKADLLLSACQVSYALQNDIRMLNNLEQHVNKLSSGPFNCRSFAILFDYLRQELLTQLNQPLLTAVSQSKKANFALLTTCSEFWSAVLKQRISNMMTILPQISHEMIRTDTLFQRLMRNYPRSPTVLRESVIIYHKSLGDHQRTLEIQSKLNKTRKNGYFESSQSSSSDLDNLDQNFQEQMEPWTTTQNVIQQLPSPGKSLIIATSVITIILLIATPIIILIISLSRVDSFLTITEPIQVIGSIQESVSRIPQLIRRYQLIKNGEITHELSEAGPPLGNLVEFINLSNTIEYLQSYTSNLESVLTSFLDLCTNDKTLDGICSDKDTETISDSTITKTTLYDGLTSFLLYVEEQSEEDPNVPSETGIKYIFDNFDSLQIGINEALSYLNEQVIEFQDTFNRLCLIYYIVTFAIPVVIIIPLIIATYVFVSKELHFDMRLFFSIPKSEISNLKWSTKSKKGKEVKQKDIIADDSSIESVQLRQEELFENLATVTKYHSGIFGNWFLAILIFIIVTCGMSALGIAVFNTSMSEIIDITDSYVSSITVSTNSVSCYVWAQEVFSKNPVVADKNAMREKSLYYIELLTSMFDGFLFGNEGESTSPGILLGQDVIDAYITSEMTDAESLLGIPMYGVIHGVYFSMSCEAQIRMLDVVAQWLLKKDQTEDFNYDNIFVYHFEHLLFAHIQPFLLTGKDLFYQKVTDGQSTKTTQLLIVYIVLLVAQILYILVFFVEQIVIILHHINTPRLLLQLVPPDGLTKSPTIMKWFSGVLTLSTKKILENKSHVNHEAVEFASNFSKCGVALTDEFLQITSANLTFMKMAHIEEYGMPVRTVLQRMLVDNNKVASLQRLEKFAKKMTTGVSKNTTFSFESQIAITKGQLETVEVKLIGHSDSEDGYAHAMSIAQSFAIVIENKSQEHMQEELIKVEHQKIEKLLAVIMPVEIKKKHDDGLDTSLQVDTGSVLVATIRVSDLEHEELVKMVNALFQSFDSVMNEDIVRIRTCQLSYIAATGLFTKTKASGQIAADTALKMIANSQKIVGESESVSVHIGIHTGTLKCGMIGVLHPVFDIVGDTAQGAMRLSELCSPWMIHISERTYGEIKFMKYNVKELGTDRHTYLISPNQFNTTDIQKVIQNIENEPQK